MLSLSLLAATGAAVLLAAVPALAVAPSTDDAPPRLRGTVTAVDEGSLTVREGDGRSFQLATGPDTTYAAVIPSSLDAVRPDEFIGTASKGPPGDWVAVEIVIVPESMRAGRLGYGGWDPLPDTSGVHASGVTETTMTNGLVSSVASAAPGLTATTMTNGTVVASEGEAGTRVLTVALMGTSETARITVSPTVPVTRFVPADRSAVPVGSVVFVKTNPGNKAGLVAAGKGVTPPM